MVSKMNIRHMLNIFGNIGNKKKSRLATKSYLHISLVSSRIISLLSTILNCFTFALPTSVFTCTTYILAGWWRTEISVRQKVHALGQTLPKNQVTHPRRVRLRLLAFFASCIFYHKSCIFSIEKCHFYNIDY